MAVVKVTRKPDWSDLDLDFIPHPTTKDVVRKKGIEAIKRAVRNLVLMNFYDKKFQSHIGSGATRLLFENINPLTATFLRNAIIDVLVYEPRIALVNDQDNGVLVQVDPDNNGYNARISFVELNSGITSTINIFLERLR